MIDDVEKISSFDYKNLKYRCLIYNKKKKPRKLSFNDILFKFSNKKKENDKYKKNIQTIDVKKLDVTDANIDDISGAFVDEFC